MLRSSLPALGLVILHSWLDHPAAAGQIGLWNEAVIWDAPWLAPSCLVSNDQSPSDLRQYCVLLALPGARPSLTCEDERHHTSGPFTLCATWGQHIYRAAAALLAPRLPYLVPTNPNQRDNSFPSFIEALAPCVASSEAPDIDFEAVYSTFQSRPHARLGFVKDRADSVRLWLAGKVWAN